MRKNRSAQELRRQAEERLQKSNPKVASPIEPEEWQKFLQELEVHQIELEMQNEELQQARTELESSLEQYTDLYDFAPVGYFTVDRTGIILNANLTGAYMMKMDRSRILNQYFDDFIHAEHKKAFLSLLEKAFLNRDREAIEIELYSAGQRKFAHIEAMVSESGRECRLALIDITVQKKAEIELQQSEQKYRILFETMSQGVMYQDPEGIIVAINPAAETILGMAAEHVQGKTPKDLQWETVHEDGSDFPGDIHPSMVALRIGEVVSDVVMGFYKPQADKYLWLNITAVPQFKPGEDRPDRVITTFEDISHIKLMVTYDKLTPREKEVFKLLVKGYSRQRISEYLKVSPKTADKHKENLMDKLGLFSIEAITDFAKQVRLI